MNVSSLAEIMLVEKPSIFFFDIVCVPGELQIMNILTNCNAELVKEQVEHFIRSVRVNLSNVSVKRIPTDKSMWYLMYFEATISERRWKHHCQAHLCDEIREMLFKDAELNYLKPRMECSGEKVRVIVSLTSNSTALNERQRAELVRVKRGIIKQNRAERQCRAEEQRKFRNDEELREFVKGRAAHYGINGGSWICEIPHSKLEVQEYYELLRASRKLLIAKFFDKGSCPYVTQISWFKMGEMYMLRAYNDRTYCNLVKDKALRQRGVPVYDEEVLEMLQSNCVSRQLVFRYKPDILTFLREALTEEQRGCLSWNPYVIIPRDP